MRKVKTAIHLARARLEESNRRFKILSSLVTLRVFGEIALGASRRQGAASFACLASPN
jgi:hypothetical protein